MKLIIDTDKIKAQGGGSETEYCRNNGIDERAYRTLKMQKRTRMLAGSKTRGVADRLIELGVAE